MTAKNEQPITLDVDAIMLSAVKTCRQTKTFDMTLADALQSIRSGKYADAVQEVRRLREAGRRPDADRIKKGLPGIMFSGRFTHRRNDAMVQHSGLCCLDFDDTGTGIKTELATDPHAVMTFDSPSGTGVKCVVAIEPASGPEEHGESFDAARKHFADRYQVDADPSGRDLARLCFASWDPDAILNSNTCVLHRPFRLFRTIHDHPDYACSEPDPADDGRGVSIPSDHKGGLYGLHNIEEIISATMPTGPGQRHRSVFKLARGLRFDAGMDGRPLKELKPIVIKWFEAARPRIATQAFVETWSDFCHAWPRVMKPLSESSVGEAWGKVQAGDHPAVAMEYDKPEVQNLVSLCYHLGRHADTFYLAMQTAADLIGVKQAMTIKRWLAMMQADELIEIVKPGTRHTATTYRWVLKTEKEANQ